MSTNLTRKDIARETGLTVDEVRRNELELGIRQHKIRINPRNIKYRREGTMEALRARGLLATTSTTAT